MNAAESACARTVTHISETIKAYRSSNKLSLDEMAKRSGVSRSMICQIEAGKVVPTIQVLTKMATGMDTSLSALIEGKGSSKQLKPQSLEELDRSVSKDGCFEYSVLNPGCLNRKVQVQRFHFKKKGERSFGPNPCGTTATLIVEAGALEIEVQGQQLALEAGTVLEFRAAREFSLRQLDKNYAQGILVTSFG